VGNGTESTYAYYNPCERLQGMQLMANRDKIMETQKSYAIDGRFRLVEQAMKDFRQINF